MPDVNELLNRIRLNIDMAELHGGSYFIEARLLLNNDLVEAIDEIKAEQRFRQDGARPGAKEREAAIPVAEY